MRLMISREDSGSREPQVHYKPINSPISPNHPGKLTRFPNW